MSSTSTGKSAGVIAYTGYATDARVMRIAESLCRAGLKVDVYTPKESGEPAAETTTFFIRLPLA